MPTVEGFTPQVLWTMIYGLLCLCILFMIVYKVYEAICHLVEKHRNKKEAQKPNFAEEVSQKVIEKLEPRFKRIEENLGKDKNRLEGHDAVLSRMIDENNEIHNGLTAICKFMLVVGIYGKFGDSKEIQDANTELQKFLAEKL